MATPITVYSPTNNFEDSYGRIAHELTKHLSSFAPTNLMSLKGGVMNHPVTGGVLLGYPTNFHKFGILAHLGVKIAYTMFESDIIPAEWVEILNDCNAVIVPSKFLVKVFKDCGVRVPIHVVPLGISEAYQPIMRNLNHRPFTFVTIGDRGLRKGWDSALFAFVKAFGDSDAVKLIIKARPGSLNIKITNPNVEIIEETYTDTQMCDLYAKCDVMVLPGKEGFGLPHREFAATGGLSMALNWGGTADDILDWGFPLDCRLEEAWIGDVIHENKGLGNWGAVVSEEYLADKMRFAFENRAECAFRGTAAAYAIKRLYSWEKCARGVYKVWKTELAKLPEMESA